MVPVQKTDHFKATSPFPAANTIPRILGMGGCVLGPMTRAGLSMETNCSLQGFACQHQSFSNIVVARSERLHATLKPSSSKDASTLFDFFLSPAKDGAIDGILGRLWRRSRVVVRSGTFCIVPQYRLCHAASRAEGERVLGQLHYRLMSTGVLVCCSVEIPGILIAASSPISMGAPRTPDPGAGGITKMCYTW